MAKKIELFRGKDSARISIRDDGDALGKAAAYDRLVKFLTRKAPRSGT